MGYHRVRAATWRFASSFFVGQTCSVHLGDMGIIAEIHRVGLRGPSCQRPSEAQHSSEGLALCADGRGRGRGTFQGQGQGLQHVGHRVLRVAGLFLRHLLQNIPQKFGVTGLSLKTKTFKTEVVKRKSSGSGMPTSIGLSQFKCQNGLCCGIPDPGLPVPQSSRIGRRLLGARRWISMLDGSCSTTMVRTQMSEGFVRWVFHGLCTGLLGDLQLPSSLPENSSSVGVVSGSFRVQVHNTSNTSGR